MGTGNFWERSFSGIYAFDEVLCKCDHHLLLGDITTEIGLVFALLSLYEKIFH